MPKPFTRKYGDMILNDTLRLFVGEHIAKGKYRDVYAFALDPTCVVKIEARDTAFCNQAEFNIWVESVGHPWRDWLAPAVYISGFGSVLIQRRTIPMRKEELPNRVPNFLNDLKLDNWGMYEGRPVCHDYGNHSIFAVAQGAMELVPAKWHDGGRAPAWHEPAAVPAEDFAI